MAKKRFRLQFKFWLDVSKSDEFELGEMIDQLKQSGSFSRAIRDGIRLVVDLWSGRVEVLLALFPWVQDYFFERFLEQQPRSDYALHEQLARLERLLIEQGNTPIHTLAQQVTTTNGGLKPMAVAKVIAPPIDDDNEVDLVITKAKSDGKSAQNFLESAFSLLG